jgi:acyl-CoA reductase-like NAD-dependent aldehyde dehydrogenase
VSRLSDQQVDAIAQQVLQRMGAERTGGRGTAPGEPAGALPQAPGEQRLGVFNDLDAAIKSARAAYEALDKLSLVKRDEIITNIRAWSLNESESLAYAAHRETGFGRYEDKVIKNRLVANKTPGTEVLQAEAKTGDRGLSLFERAPFGVIGSITPSTNPTSTIINNTISMVAAGNAVVFNVHPSAKECSIRCVDIINRAIVEVGGPANLVVTMAEPTIESA